MVKMTRTTPADRVPVQGYGNGGFRFQGAFKPGSLLLLPSGPIPWSAVTMADLSEDSMAPLLALGGEVDLVILGTGDTLEFPPAGLTQRFSEIGIGLEPMATGPACRTYNVLLAEERRLAGALLAVEGPSL